MNCNRCDKGGALVEPLACVVSACAGDRRPVFVKLCARCVTLAQDGGALVEFDVIPRALPKWELARLSAMVGAARMPKETGYYVRLKGDA